MWCDYVNFDAKIAMENSCDINLLPDLDQVVDPEDIDEDSQDHISQLDQIVKNEYETD